ncbi:MAG: hypothetical protein HYX42_08095 [Polaromonas sp.]|uniref:CBASS cGAMP synthase n=1 Tax=Polaromonas sp. TaxID=1869339 RepID=UPI0025DF08A8|nr:CBASS cGAMP synthase [Polaromonas sp.]MBI2726195.1 hypothetical protein [Polaromonas sp.]
MLNLSPLFHTEVEDSTLLKNITLGDAECEFILEAKEAVRKQLRVGLPRLMKEAGYEKEAVPPRFFTQGSWAYKTINAPCHLPPQQADIDDGAYLPLSFMTETGRPRAASQVFFKAAETALEPLVKERGWKLVTDKATCIRIVIARSAHIDIPLYAIPDVQFEELRKAAMNNYTLGAQDEAVIKAERDAWTALPRDKVLLAHREEGWKPSDPRPVKKWFIEEVDRLGEQFRRSVRYLKAFRDWQWPTGGPSSILLMAAAAPVFDSRDRRDDLALLDLVEAMQERLRKGVCNPTDETESLTDRLGKDGVEDAIRKLKQLEDNLRGAINASNADQACQWLINQFGSRFPHAPERVKPTTATATVQAVPAAAVASPLVGRSQAG